MLMKKLDVYLAVTGRIMAQSNSMEENMNVGSAQSAKNDAL